MRRDLIDKYDLRLPRYTSYPTAPHFGPQVGAETFGKWLSGLDPSLPLSLYLHIAYCAEMCWFCGCHTKITKQYAPVADYLEALLAEIDTVAEAIPAGMTTQHIHFGGGSPTILKAEDLSRLIGHLRSRFPLRDKAEIAVELDPRTADEAYVKAMAEAGVGRASIGVQDFKPEVQEAIHRVQSNDLVVNVIGWLRRHGITDLNMDLVYGLPHQTVESVRETIDRAVDLGPKRVSLFGYAHVPWMRRHQKMIPEDTLPDMEERWLQYEAAHQRFAEHGYVAIGLDHFAAPDDEMALALKEERLNRNFQGYTTDSAPVLIGLGASGISSLPQGYAVNEMDINAYKATVREGKLATTRGFAVNEDDRLRRDIIERLMCDLSVDLNQVGAPYGVSAADFEKEVAALSDLAADGVVSIEDGRILVTHDGRPLVRAAAAVFDTYLVKGEQRHSKAV